MKLSAGIASLLIGSSAFAANYTLDSSHGEVGFSVKHLMISNVKGNFSKFKGGFEFDAAKKELKNISVEIDAASVSTNEPKRDEHLKSPEFLDTAKFGQMTFKGEKAEFKGDKPVKVSGTLTLHGVSKPVTLDIDYGGTAVDPWGNHRVAFTASTTIKRKDYGLTWNKQLDGGGVVVGDDVKINIESEAIAEKAAK
jgi:polyisoprenoid-binding protein YceI